MRRGRRGAVAVSGRNGVMLPTGEQAAAIDLAAHPHVPARVLMENAGRAAAAVLHRLHPRGRIAGFAGGGNNGGDLLVALRSLHTWGRDVEIFQVGDRQPDRSLLHGFDIPVLSFSAGVSPGAAADVLVDGILGIGANGPPRPDAAAAITHINGLGRPVVALDLPTGVDATTGGVPGDVIHAHTTITFGWPKLGMLLYPARAHCGRILAVDISFPPMTDDVCDAEAITPGWAFARAPQRRPDAHKGSSGRLLLLAGESGMAGAAVLAAGAAVRTGAGLVRIASDHLNRSVLQLSIPEATFIDRATLDAAAVQSATAIIAGPGMGDSAEARAALDVILQHGAGIPTLLDADALNMLARDRAALQAAAADRQLLVTPHPKELSRLLDMPLDAIVADRIAAARLAAQTLQCVVLLKGQPSVVADAAQDLLVNVLGTSDVATAGMGDQLAGVIGGFLALGCVPRDAAALGLHYAGRAAHLAHRGRSLSPADVTDRLAAAFAGSAHTESTLKLPFITFDQPLPS